MPGTGIGVLREGGNYECKAPPIPSVLERLSQIEERLKQQEDINGLLASRIADLESTMGLNK